MPFLRWPLGSAALIIATACGSTASEQAESDRVPTNPGTGTEDANSSVSQPDAATDGPGDRPDGGQTDGDAAVVTFSRAANAERFAHAQCVGELGLYHRASGKDPGTTIGGFFGRHPKPRTCQTRSVGACTSIACPGDSFRASFYKGGITYSSSVGDRYVSQRGDGYLTGTTNQPLLPPVGENVGIAMRKGTPTARAFDLPAPGEVGSLVAPLKSAKIPKAGGLLVSWTNTSVVPTSTVLITLSSPTGRVECLTDATSASLNIPAALTAELPAGEVDIQVDAASERFDDDDDECVVRTLLTRANKPIWTSVTFE